VPVAAIHDVVDRTGIFDSQLARHDGRVAGTASVVNIDSAYNGGVFQQGFGVGKAFSGDTA
jgi:hypothetical protein